jgi:hypothetical protein
MAREYASNVPLPPDPPEIETIYPSYQVLLSNRLQAAQRKETVRDAPAASLPDH